MSDKEKTWTETIAGARVRISLRFRAPCLWAWDWYVLDEPRPRGKG